MHLKNLRLYNFRNISSLSVEFHPRRNFIIGNNGQGKTNLVEAITLISHGKSFRTSDARELLKHGEVNASVFGEVQDRLSNFEIGLSYENYRKQAFIDGERIAALEDYIGRLPCVVFSPDDLMLVKGAPAARRAFIDRHIAELNPSSISDIINLNRAVKSKSKLLVSGTASVASLEAWNRIISDVSSRVMQRRISFIEELRPLLTGYYRSIAPDDTGIDVSLKSSLGDYTQTWSGELLFDILMEKARIEISAKRALFGPHRDDLLLSLGGKDARAFASQGQTRSMVLAMKMSVIAHYEMEKNESPLVLLDDVDSELDVQRRNGVFSIISESGRQVFITGTSKPGGVGDHDDSITLSVEGGSVSQHLA